MSLRLVFRNEEAKENKTSTWFVMKKTNKAEVGSEVDVFALDVCKTRKDVECVKTEEERGGYTSARRVTQLGATESEAK